MWTSELLDNGKVSITLTKDTDPDWYAMVFQDDDKRFHYTIGKRGQLTGSVKSYTDNGNGWETAETAQQQALHFIEHYKKEEKEKAEALKRFEDSITT